MTRPRAQASIPLFARLELGSEALQGYRFCRFLWCQAAGLTNLDETPTQSACNGPRVKSNAGYQCTAAVHGKL